MHKFIDLLKEVHEHLLGFWSAPGYALLASHTVLFMVGILVML